MRSDDRRRRRAARVGVEGLEGRRLLTSLAGPGQAVGTAPLAGSNPGELLPAVHVGSVYGCGGGGTQSILIGLL